MDKELFEQYVVEANQLRQQVEILLRIINLLSLEEDYQYEVSQLDTTGPATVKIMEGKVYVNPQ